MNRTIYVIDIEPLDNRYTKQWQQHVPYILKEHLPHYNIVNISGKTENYTQPTSGSFFDFSLTCQYKASQAYQISQLFANNTIKPNDIFLFTDAWNPTVHTVRYISELSKIPVKISGIWHAGWYDKTDILGYTITKHNWVKPFELSMYNAYDMNFFATGHHVDTFKSEHNVDKSNILLCGYPLDYLKNIVYLDYSKKVNRVVFPHRLNDDKAPYVFDWLGQIACDIDSNIEFVKTQSHNLDKDSYYDLISTCKVVFSCNKHENLGISTFECVNLGCVPVVPDKLSYTEMYPIQYRYKLPDVYYSDKKYWVPIAEKIVNIVHNYNEYTIIELLNVSKHIYERYFTSDRLIHYIKQL